MPVIGRKKIQRAGFAALSPFFDSCPLRSLCATNSIGFRSVLGQPRVLRGGSKSRRARPGGGQLWAIPEAEVPKTRQNCGNTGNNSQIQCYGPKYSATGQSTMLPPAAPCGKIALDRGDRISRPQPRRFGQMGNYPSPPVCLSIICAKRGIIPQMPKPGISPQLLRAGTCNLHQTKGEMNADSLRYYF